MEKMIAAGGLVLNERNELLMIFRRGKWDLPKGKLDEGETIEACAVREVEEETGLRNIQLHELIDTTLHTYTEKGKTIEKLTYWYCMQTDSKQQLIPQTEEDIQQIKWIPVTDIHTYLENTYDNIIAIIRKSGFIRNT